MKFDCRNSVVRRRQLAAKLPGVVEHMLRGLDEFVSCCSASKVNKNQITSRRILLNRSTLGLETEARLRSAKKKVKLIVTSPPYPGVHVLVRSKYSCGFWCRRAHAPWLR